MRRFAPPSKRIAPEDTNPDEYESFCEENFWPKIKFRKFRFRDEWLRVIGITRKWEEKSKRFVILILWVFDK